MIFCRGAPEGPGALPHAACPRSTQKATMPVPQLTITMPDGTNSTAQLSDEFARLLAAEARLSTRQLRALFPELDTSPAVYAALVLEMFLMHQIVHHEKHGGVLC